MNWSSNQAIRVEHIFKRYGPAVAVDDVSFDVKQGEFVSLLGPSGCGKTTTLRMIAGFIMPSEGSIHVNGADVTHLPPEKRNVGFVFQNYALWPHMTVAENVAFGLKLRKCSKAVISRKIEESLAVTGLSGYEARFPRQLSGGQQQRVALARALALEPQLLLMDEPLSNLDRALRVAMRRELKQLQRRLNMTTLYVTHDQEEALSMSDRVVVMCRGEVARVARPFEIYDDPQSGFVADFVGTSNFLDGVVSEVGDDFVTLQAGPSLFVRMGGHIQLEKGAQARVLVRPERTELLQQKAESENVLPAKVSFIEYFGPTIRYSVELESGKTLHVEAHNINRPSAIGDQVWVRIDPRHFRLIGSVEK